MPYQSLNRKIREEIDELKTKDRIVSLLLKELIRLEHEKGVYWSFNKKYRQLIQNGSKEWCDNDENSKNCIE